MNSTSQAQIFATEYAKNAAKNMLDVIESIGTRAGRITKIALGVSMPHQIGYILALAVPHMSWHTPSGILESITMILLAVGVPIATDLLILNCIETIGAAAASKGSKVRAFALMFIPVFASGTVNFLAPAPTLIKVLAAFIVTMVPMAESLRFIRPDFAKIERMETEVAAQITPQAVVVPAPVRATTVRPTQAELDARKRAGYARMPAGEKAAWTRDYRTRQAKRVNASIPVSPPPASGVVRDLTPAEELALASV